MVRVRELDRRGFLRSAGVAASAALIGKLPACSRSLAEPEPGDWAAVRERFEIDEGVVHLAGLLLAPHPEPVRAAVARHRAALDENPAVYVEEHDGDLKRRSREAAARYMGAEHEDVALTDSTTMGIGLVYAGLRIGADREVLTTDQDYHATHDALELRAARGEATFRQVRLFDDIHGVSPDGLVDRLMSEVGDRTRALAVTWVHSRTGLKLPVRRLADRLREHNAGRDPADRVLLCLDGVHGLGVEDVDIPDLGCDFFFAGTHKWVFGPRGTGVLWGSPEVQSELRPTIPTFIRDGTWGGDMSPGGFKAFEHQWSMAEAFQFHEEAGGRGRVRDRIHDLARHLKEGLADMQGVTLHTPLDEELSSGIVCFEVEGLSPEETVDRLLERRIVASVTPYAPPLARFAPGLLNDHAEMDRTLAVVRGIAG